MHGMVSGGSPVALDVTIFLAIWAGVLIGGRAVWRRLRSRGHD